MTSLSKNARVAGILYIVASVIGFGRLMYIPDKLFVHGNAAATANNVATHEMLFRLGIVGYLVSATLFVFVTLALYRLFKGVDQGLAALMVILGSLIPVPIFFVNSLTDGAALLFVRGDNFLSAFDKPKRDALAMMDELDSSTPRIGVERQRGLNPCPSNAASSDLVLVHGNI